jgi:hypothetical protein
MSELGRVSRVPSEFDGAQLCERWTPDILTRKTRLWLRNFVINDAKRLLQHNRHLADVERVESNDRFFKHSMLMRVSHIPGYEQSASKKQTQTPGYLKPQ